MTGPPAAGREPLPERRPVLMAEAAKRLGVTSDALRKRVQRGQGQGYKLDGRWYFYMADESGPVAGPDSVATAPEVTRLLTEIRDMLSVLIEAQRALPSPVGPPPSVLSRLLSWRWWTGYD